MTRATFHRDRQGQAVGATGAAGGSGLRRRVRALDDALREPGAAAIATRLANEVKREAPGPAFGRARPARVGVVLLADERAGLTRLARVVGTAMRAGAGVFVERPSMRPVPMEARATAVLDLLHPSALYAPLLDGDEPELTARAVLAVRHGATGVTVDVARDGFAGVLEAREAGIPVPVVARGLSFEAGGLPLSALASLATACGADYVCLPAMSAEALASVAGGTGTAIVPVAAVAEAKAVLAAAGGRGVVLAVDGSGGALATAVRAARRAVAAERR